MDAIMKYTFYLVVGIVVVVGLLYMLKFIQNVNLRQYFESSFDQSANLGNSVDAIESGATRISNDQKIDSEEWSAISYPLVTELMYIEAIDWPPFVQVLKEPYFCTPDGDFNTRAGRTEVRIINGTPYCVTEVREGAVGSNYHRYAYVFAEGGKAVLLMFSFRYVYCDIYDKEKARECKDEQHTLDIGQLVDTIRRTSF